MIKVLLQSYISQVSFYYTPIFDNLEIRFAYVYIFSSYFEVRGSNDTVGQWLSCSERRGT